MLNNIIQSRYNQIINNSRELERVTNKKENKNMQESRSRKENKNQ
jgi:hypothetical protein